MKAIARGLGRTVGPVIDTIGKAVEKTALSIGAKPTEPAYVAYRNLWDLEEGKTKLEQRWDLVVVPSKFIAPTASVSGEAQVEDGAGVWYNAVLKGKVSVGKNSSVLDHASVEGSSSKPTILGNNVIVHPLAKVGEGVTIGDRSVVCAAAKVEAGVVIESDAMVAQGSHVLSGTTIKSKELWAGNPAVMIRTLEAFELASNQEFVEETARLGGIHTKENSKDIYTDHAARQLYKDRHLFAEDIMEDNPDLDIFLNVDVNPNLTPERRGLFFDSKNK